MKRIAFLIWIVSAPMLSYAQSNIVTAEYFFDIDPGTGAATALPAFTASPNLDVTFLAASSVLSQGMHILGIRVRDVNNLWSIPTFLPVYILANSPIIAGAEYFFDTDPGSGNATPISVTSGATIDVTFAANSSALPIGMHVMGVRTRNALNNWSVPAFVPFYIDRSRTITKLEYFFDTDPGSGNATTVVVTPPTDLLDQIYSMNSSALALGAHTLSVRVAGQNNFWSIPETVSFTITAPPTITSFTPPSGIVGSTVTITGTNFDTTPANNAVAFNGTPATVTASSATSITTTVPVGATTGPITVTIFGSTATSSTNFIVCPNAPTVTPSSGCENTSVTLTASGGTNGQYRWYTVATGGTAITGEVNSSYTTPALTSATIYYVAINNGFCESSRTPVTATVQLLPSKPIITVAGSTTICPGQSVTLSAPIGFGYSWSNGATSRQITVSSAGAYTVQVTDNGCTSVASDPVVVSVSTCNQPPVISTTALQAVVEGYAALKLTDIISDPDNNIDLSTLKIVQLPISGAAASIDINYNLILNYQGISFAGTDELTLEVCDFDGECSQQVLTIEVIGDIVFYNALSPNGDNKNPTFHIQYIELLSDTQRNKVFIYNRWGDVVWEGVNYDNQSVVFTGLNTNGNELPTGNYFYKIQFNSGRKTETGYLSIKR